MSGEEVATTVDSMTGATPERYTLEIPAQTKSGGFQFNFFLKASMLVEFIHYTVGSPNEQLTIQETYRSWGRSMMLVSYKAVERKNPSAAALTSSGSTTGARSTIDLGWADRALGGRSLGPEPVYHEQIGTPRSGEAQYPQLDS